MESRLRKKNNTQTEGKSLGSKLKASRTRTKPLVIKPNTTTQPKKTKCIQNEVALSTDNGLKCFQENCHWKKEFMTQQEIINNLKKYLSIERDRTRRIELQLEAEKNSNGVLHQKIGKLEFQIASQSSNNVKNFRRVASCPKPSNTLIDISCSAGYFGGSQSNNGSWNQNHSTSAAYAQHPADSDNFYYGESVEQSACCQQDIDYSEEDDNLHDVPSENDDNNCDDLQVFNSRDDNCTSEIPQDNAATVEFQNHESIFDTEGERVVSCGDINTNGMRWMNRALEDTANEDQCPSQDSNVPVKTLSSKNRIVDIEHYFDALQQIYTMHGNYAAAHGEQCSYLHLQLQKSINKGLKTKVRIRCSQCSFVKWIDLIKDTADALTINESVVAASMFSGIIYNNAQELLAGVDVPFMTAKTYQTIRESLILDFEWAVMKEMEEGARLERELAIGAGDVIDGIPFITVIADGSWGKRSYRSGKHDSLSGMAAIIGQRTGKVLYAGIHNKYCSLCSWYERKKLQPREHKCFKTWGRNESSGSMEQNIIVTGFRCSIEMHNLVYKTLITDGDSSVYKMILDARPYKSLIVEKIECSNHLLRNFCNKIVDCSKTKNLNIPRGSVGPFRQMLSKSAFKYRRCVGDAMKKRASEPNLSDLQKANLLQQDIINLFEHVYGDHSKCQELGINCDPVKANKDKNYFPLVQSSGVYISLKVAVDSLSSHSDSLICGFTSNIVESFNNCIAKTIGGKRTNQSCREGYYERCLAAILIHNSQRGLTKLNEHNLCQPPHEIMKLEAYREGKTANWRENYKKNGRKKKYMNPRKDGYGDECKKPDMKEDRFDRLKLDMLEKLKLESSNSEAIERETVGQSKNKKWFLYKRDRLTASHFGRICLRKKNTRTCNIVRSVLYPKDISKIPAVAYGIDHEPEALQKLSEQIGEEILPCGLFIDRDLHFLGASPDGLIGNDNIAEVKCLLSIEGMSLAELWNDKKYHSVRRIFDKNSLAEMNKKHRYFFQVQGQLHVTRKKWCIFAIWNGRELHHVTVDRDDEFWNKMMAPKLIKFFMDCLLPELIDPRSIRGMPLREPDWLPRVQVGSNKNNYDNPALSTTSRKRKHINDLCHLIGETEPPRRRTRFDGANSPDDQQPCIEVDQEPANSLNDQQTFMEVNEDTFDDRERLSEHTDDEDISDYSIFGYSDDDSYDYSESSLDDSDYHNSENFSDDYGDYEDLDNHQNSGRDNQHHEQYGNKNKDQHNQPLEQHGNKNSNRHNKPPEQHGNKSNNRQCDVIDGPAFEQPLNPDQVQEYDAVLENLAFDGVDNASRRINFVLQPSFNLEDDLIDLFLNILINNIVVTRKNIFVHPIHYFTYPMLLGHIGALDCNERQHVQIIGDTQTFHWRCLHYDGTRLKIYDSLPSPEAAKFSDKEKRYISIRYPHINFDDIEFPTITRQPFGTNTCGVYAAAVATTLALGEDPAQIEYSRNEDVMRFHYHQIVTNNIIVEFPTAQ